MSRKISMKTVIILSLIIVIILTIVLIYKRSFVYENLTSNNQPLNLGKPNLTIDNFTTNDVTFSHPQTTMTISQLNRLASYNNSTDINNDLQIARDAVLKFAKNDIKKPNQAVNEIYDIGHATENDLKYMSETQRNNTIKLEQEYYQNVKNKVYYGSDRWCGNYGDTLRCYYHTLAYLITNDDIYAEKAISLINDWSITCKKFGLIEQNGPLVVGWGLSNFAISAEILKYKYPKWKNTDVENNFKKFFDTVLKTNITDFYSNPKNKPENMNLRYTNNWATTITYSRLTYAIFTDSKREFIECLKIMKFLLDTTIDDTGRLLLETTRDMSHAQYAIGGFIAMAEVFYKFGIDFYSYRKNILAKLCFIT